MADPYKQLAAALESRMNRVAAKQVAGVPAELGTMTGAGLKLDSFKYEMPDYLQAEGLQLMPGDRVLALPVAGGSQAVVVCKVVNASG